MEEDNGGNNIIRDIFWLFPPCMKYHYDIGLHGPGHIEILTILSIVAGSAFGTFIAFNYYSITAISAILVWIGGMFLRRLEPPQLMIIVRSFLVAYLYTSVLFIIFAKFFKL